MQTAGAAQSTAGEGAEIMLTDKERAALLSSVIDRARADLNDGKPLTEMQREADSTTHADAAVNATNVNFGLEHPPLRSLTEAAEDAFNAAWAQSPPSMRNYVERDVAQFFYLTGQRDGCATATEILNGDWREMERLAKGQQQ
jgi:hypothetical protein